ncbi:MAG: hypothetical protein H6887_00840 [Hoeflea sp.]|nr:hypothetical protein [Hoeflea sp.]
MKLEDLDRIRELAETLDFNSTLLKRLSATAPRLVIGHGRDAIQFTMPPSIMTLVTESISETLTETIMETEAELTALGIDFSAKSATLMTTFHSRREQGHGSDSAQDPGS